MLSVEKLYIAALISLLCVYMLHFPVPVPLYVFTIPLFIVASILYLTSNPTSKLLVIVFALFSFFSIVHLFLVSFLFHNTNFVSSLRFLGFSGLFFVIGSNEKLLSKIKTSLFFVSLVLLGSGLLVYLFAPELVSIRSYDSILAPYRFKLLFSEPSALAALTGILVMSAIERSKPLILLIPVGIIIATQSIIVILVSLFALIYSLRGLPRLSWSSFRIFSVCLAAFFLGSSIEFSSGDYSLIVDRVPELVEALSFNSSIEGLTGVNARSANLYKLIEIIEDNPGSQFGVGLNSNTLSQANEISSFSILHTFTEGFGLIGFFGCCFLAILTIFFLRSTPNAWLSVFVFYAMINSAQGLLMQGFFFTAIGFLVHRYKCRPGVIRESY